MEGNSNDNNDIEKDIYINNSELIKLNELLSQKDQIIIKLKKELELIKKKSSLDKENIDLNKDSSIQIEKLKNEKETLLKQNNEIKNELDVKENYIKSLMLLLLN